MEMLETEFMTYTVWECLSEVRVYNPQEKKLDPRTISVYFIGYTERSKGYRFYCPSHSTRIVESRNAKFLENDLISGRKCDTTLRISTKARKTTIPSDYVVYLQESDYDIGTENDPETFSQAISCKESNLWYDAMKDEMNSMASIGFGILLSCLMV
ncbi:hypothetical protein CK203_027914 [Vitis vinifera]|uniref:Retroviral polymerase SH3-like domain-containing protein n=1 Tax=Vitis vinifera TaxID=29760 RepID=A0A438J3R4_VITVI|nr:hypothetical protein CK203_027914 [Vitis vinifera]